MKNGGSHFLVEVASREFVDNLLSLLKAPLGINHEVRGRMLELIQAWALAFESRSDLGYMMSTYQSLRTEGLQFPPEERIAAAFVDSAAPPDWADSDVCMRCRTAFTFRNRKHHCRNCGNVFCGQCSTQTMTLPHLGINEPVRVCDGCHSNRAQSVPSNQQIVPPRSSVVPSYLKAPPARQSSRAAVSADGEDLELKRALELSLAESGSRSQTAIKPQAKSRSVQEMPDEDDVDLKAAIEASLRDRAPAQKAELYSYPMLGPSASGPSASKDSYISRSMDAVAGPEARAPIVSAHELQPVEQENIKLFAHLVDRLKADPQGAILRDSQIQELYESILSLRPKIARSLGDTVGKYESLVETHSKLAAAVKHYDQLLEARLASTYTRAPPYQGSREAFDGRRDAYSNSYAQSYDDTATPSYYEQYNNIAQHSHQNRSDYYENPEVSHEDEAQQFARGRYHPSQAPAGYPQNHEEPQPATHKEEVSLIDL